MSRKLEGSAKPWGNILRRVTPIWHTQSNQSGYFFNASPGTRGMSFPEWRILSRKKICLVFSSERKIPLTHLRSSKYNAVQEIWIESTEYSDISKVKVSKFSAGKRGTNSGRDGERGIIQLPSHYGAQGKKT